jgi:hypothetical protein
MDTSTQYRLSLVDDAILANADDPAAKAKLVAYRATIADSRPSRDVGELPGFAGRLSDGTSSRTMDVPSATGPQYGFIGRLMAERDLAALTLQSARYFDKLVAKYRNDNISKAEASELIDWLNDQPMLAANEDKLLMARRLVGPRPASEAQLRMVNARRSAKGLRPLAALELLAIDVDEELAMVAAMPDTKRPTEATAITDGMYRKNDQIYKVQKAVHGSGHLYAKRLVKLDEPRQMARGIRTHEFEYASGVVSILTPADKMTLEEAKTWGALYGTCCCCGALLTDEKSIEAGIGPICAGKF